MDGCPTSRTFGVWEKKRTVYRTLHNKKQILRYIQGSGRRNPEVKKRFLPGEQYIFNCIYFIHTEKSTARQKIIRLNASGPITRILPSPFPKKEGMSNKQINKGVDKTSDTSNK